MGELDGLPQRVPLVTTFVFPGIKKRRGIFLQELSVVGLRQ